MGLIGVVPSWVEDRKVTVSQDYPDAILRAGGLPVVFSVTAGEKQISGLLDQVDGLLLTGGADIDPARYGETKRNCCGDCSPCRDTMEFPLCREALRRRMPVLAICRGMQLLSCVLGGTLFQDLAEQFGSKLCHPRNDVPRDPVHEVTICPGSLLYSVIGSDLLEVNSRHHQGIKVPGEGLRISAVAPDGLAEGIELPDFPFVLGVQWHPESLCSRYPMHQKLFDAFVRACSGEPSL